jgi:serine/threonine-protein kinase HipA
MTERRCLLCYESLGDKDSEMHPACARRLFGSPEAPRVDCTRDDITRLALQVVLARITVPGVQAKLSLGLSHGTAPRTPDRLTLVDTPGGYILKPPGNAYPYLPELEDLCMHLAGDARIATVPHGLVRLASGELAYLTKRIDRDGQRMVHMEDMCQLSGKPTEAKYRGSHEQVARLILRHSAAPLLDVIAFYERVLFCFFTGNSDMHLKNFSLIKDVVRGTVLSPAYDLVATSLVLEEDPEELALTLNGKKRKLQRADFEAAMRGAGMEEKVIANLFMRIARSLPRWEQRIERSFVPRELGERLRSLVRVRLARLGMG